MSGYVDISNFQDLSIVDFLARLGHQPVKKTGKEYFYHSMLRETRKSTPSFTVWDTAGKWIDRGGPGESDIYAGGIVQLGMALWPRLPFVEVLSKIRETCNLDIAAIPQYVAPQRFPEEKDDAGYKWELVNTKPLGSNYAITEYLRSRGILDVAQGHLQEVYYRRKDSPQDQRPYFAVGWLNEHGNFEFGNLKGFKSSIGAKGISIIEGDNRHLAVFEGIYDYLSWLKKTEIENKPTVYVLNAITMLNSCMERIKGFPKVDVYGDRDQWGMKCTERLIKEVPHARDRSEIYNGFKDYNDMLKAEPNRERSRSPPDIKPVYNRTR